LLAETGQLGCHGIAFAAWPYEKIPTRLEEAYGMPNLAANRRSGGLRGNIMRTPGQRQQTFALEGDEWAAASAARSLQFRVNHTTQRLTTSQRHAKAAGWKLDPRRTHAPQTGNASVTGRGLCIRSFATTLMGWHRGNRRHPIHGNRAGDQVRHRVDCARSSTAELDPA